MELYLISDGSYDPETGTPSTDFENRTALIIEGTLNLNAAIKKFAQLAQIETDEVVVNAIASPIYNPNT